MYSELPTLKIKLKNPVVSHSVKIWTQIRKHFKWKECSVHTPLSNNHTFTPSLSDFTFNHWHLKGIQSIQEMFTDKIFSTFRQLQEKFNIHNRDFFKYLQIRSYVKKRFPSFPNQPPECIMNSVLLSDPLKRGSISKIYNNLSQMDCTATLDHLKEAWQEDLAVEISGHQWTKAQDRVHSSSVCTRHGLIQFKILHRLHLSKLKLSKMFPAVNPLCDRCGQTPASLAHICSGLVQASPPTGPKYSKVYQRFSRNISIQTQFLQCLGLGQMLWSSLYQTTRRM